MCDKSKQLFMNKDLVFPFGMVHIGYTPNLETKIRKRMAYMIIYIMKVSFSVESIVNYDLTKFLIYTLSWRVVIPL